MSSRNLRFAIQRNGRLTGGSLRLLNKLGVSLSDQEKDKLIARTSIAELEVLFVRVSDIPEYVQASAADFGIVGQNILYEKNFKVKPIAPLSFGECRLVLAVPEESSIKNIYQLESERIATSYPKSLKKFLKNYRINASVIEIKGSVEVTPSLGLADAVCDIVQSGKTLKENRLKELQTVIPSTAVLIQSYEETSEKTKFISLIKKHVYEGL